MSVNNVILFGAPGSGKGTQAPLLESKYGLCHLSTGDMLRDAVSRKTQAGNQAKQAMDSGALVSDEIVINIVSDAIQLPKCSTGFILDGFPRTKVQAEKLDALLQGQGKKLDKVISFEVPDDVITARASGRWIHKASGRTYHSEFAPPKVPGKDDVTGEQLIQRPDDKVEIVEKRLKLFHEDISPILSFYKSKGILRSVDGNHPVGEVHAKIVNQLEQKSPWWKLW
ncbi:hypothetical protein XU18_1845 [Perkinsela sp. CCAP 1560/4]|nr:hypothetical protein XU18_1845 [Perkinsela sp. CCAP 1560/4]|eukprot:KNH07313.1 hypothetical protein XU18_1845 [Perkinsela sp. CCAP 1560/4]